LPSTSISSAPRASAVKTGSPSTARKARTGGLTPPGKTSDARRSSSGTRGVHRRRACPHRHAQASAGSGAPSPGTASHSARPVRAVSRQRASSSTWPSRERPRYSALPALRLRRQVRKLPRPTALLGFKIVVRRSGVTKALWHRWPPRSRRIPWPRRRRGPFGLRWIDAGSPALAS
jgi:hypothetical protein